MKKAGRSRSAGVAQEAMATGVAVKRLSLAKSRISFFAALMMLPSLAYSQTWQGAQSSDFMVGENWDGGAVPNGGAVTINSTNPSGAGAVLSSGSVSVSAATVGGAGEQGKLTINGGTFSASQSMQVGVQNGSVGEVIVTGAGSLLDVAGGMRITAAGNALSTGTFTLAEGATVTTTNIELSTSNATAVGTLNIGRGLAAGTLNATSIIGGRGTATVNFNHSDLNYVLSAGMSVRDTSSRLIVNHIGSGRTVLTGSTTYDGLTTISSGALVFAGTDNDTVKRDLLGSMTVANGATLGLGVGTVRSGVKLTIGGDLSFGNTSLLEMGLGAPGSTPDAYGVGDLIDVKGKLTLGGTIKIVSLNDALDFGRYELFRFGTLDASQMGSMTVNIAGGLTGGLETASGGGVGGRVILNIAQALGNDVYWVGADGVGGAGVWDAATTNWSNESEGSFRDVWNSSNAIFDGEGADVSIVGEIAFAQINFDADDYVLTSGGAGSKLVATPAEGSIAILNAFTDVTGRIETVLEGAGSDTQIRKQGAGTVILSGATNSWGGGTVVSAGTLQIGDGGSTGSLPGNVEVLGAGTLAFHRDSYSYGGVVNGAGGLRQVGGSTTLTGANTYAGQTTVAGGTLTIGNGSSGNIAANSAVRIEAAGTLALNRSGEYTFANAIEGVGSLAQRGGGTLTLTGSLSSFTGKLLAESGSISLPSNAVFNGTVDVQQGGVLKGTGKVGGARILSGGRLAPGNSIGTLTLGGALTLENGGIFEAEVGADGSHDLVAVTGNLTLNGSSLEVLALGDEINGLWRPYNSYDLITYTGTRSGTFDDERVTSNFAFLTPELEYGNGVVRLHLDRNDIDFAAIGLTPNQIAAGGATEALDFDHVVANQALALVDAVLVLSPEDARAAFDSLSGEFHVSTRSMLLDDSRLLRDAILGRAHAHLNGANGDELWGQVLGHQGSYQGDGVSEFKRDAAGIMAGKDYALGEGSFRLGWAAGYHMNASLESSALGSEGDANSTHVAIYGGTRQTSGLGVRLGIAHSWHEVDVRRTVSFPGYREAVESSYEGKTVQAFGEVDLKLTLGSAEVSPFLGLAWAQLQTDGFAEMDFQTPLGSTAGLRANAQTDDASFATLGARGSVPLMGEHAQLNGMLGYRRALSGDDPMVRMAFLDGTQRFDVRGAPLARDAAIADLGLDFSLSEKVHLGASYNGLLSKDAADHAIQARLVWTLE